jgi:hypothetical protein
MEKQTITKRRYSDQSKSVFLFESFRPLATSTPYEIGQSHLINTNSPRPLLTPPVFCSTPKQSRRQLPTSSVKRKMPIVISQRRLQFTTNSNNESKRITIKNVKIWLL